ncbi:Small-conductance mechanosensitive channel [Polaribacter huanghezhanensis]|uniref:mechanosensitive ion channel family protein n=1 Tax=Polaribacter huanghezhanensis TaxID=1354726 RepID=UPI002649D4EB|nr:mechanosensitive ion channel domain-containing protein [Polaribacter huanghezhanensis]WKD85665.1 Small-conductance mechanosensitive channel [Polaribacter huanghezhanensis]
MEKYLEIAETFLLKYGTSILSALLILIIGLIVINLFVKLSKKIMTKSNVDLTLQKFLSDLLSWILKALLVITVVSKLGVETSSFVAIIGAAGLAVGLALQGSLANFAGGALIMIFKPFKIGDFISAQGESGTVKSIEIFTTKLNTVDNKEVIIPNGALSNNNIVNFSTEEKRRVDLKFGVSYDADIKETKQVLASIVNKHPLILKDPAPAILLVELADSSINFAVKSWVKSGDYWTVYAEVLEQTKEALDKAGIEIPYPHRVEIKKII